MVQSLLELDEISKPVRLEATKSIMDENPRRFRQVAQKAHLPEDSWKKALSPESKDEVLSAANDTFSKISPQTCEEVLGKWEKASL